MLAKWFTTFHHAGHPNFFAFSYPTVSLSHTFLAVLIKDPFLRRLRHLTFRGYDGYRSLRSGY
jgi:hypothetical protein